MELQTHKNVLETELNQEKLGYLLKTDELNVTSSNGEYLGKMTLKEMMRLAQENVENRN